MIFWAYCSGSEISKEIKGDTWSHLIADQLLWASSTSSHLNTGPPEETLGPTYTQHPFPLAKVTFNYRKGLLGEEIALDLLLGEEIQDSSPIPGNQKKKHFLI